MSIKTVAISGCSGGVKGPLGLYATLKQKLPPKMDFIAIDTIPDDIENNVKQVVAEALSHQGAESGVYLMGYSMGGAVAALSAYQLQQSNPGVVKGVILLSPQTDGLSALGKLNLPVLAFIGENDEYFTPREITRSLKDVEKKEICIIEGVGHNLANNKTRSSKDLIKLAARVNDEFKKYFNQPLIQEPQEDLNWIDRFLITLRISFGL
jgi:pimeloyl-ACP methyl ester carboxylesterase